MISGAEMFWDQWTLTQANHWKTWCIGLTSLFGFATLILGGLIFVADKTITRRTDEAAQAAAASAQARLSAELSHRDEKITGLESSNAGLSSELAKLAPRVLTTRQKRLLSEELRTAKFPNMTIWWSATGEPQNYAAQLKGAVVGAGQPVSTAEWLDPPGLVGITIPADLNGHWRKLRAAFKAAGIPTTLNREIGGGTEEATVIVGAKPKS